MTVTNTFTLLWNLPNVELKYSFVSCFVSLPLPKITKSKKKENPLELPLKLTNPISNPTSYYIRKEITNIDFFFIKKKISVRLNLDMRYWH